MEVKLRLRVITGPARRRLRMSAMVGKQKLAESRGCSNLGDHPSLMPAPATSALPPITDMSPFARFTSGVGPIADVVGRLCRRQELIRSCQSRADRKGLLTGLNGSLGDGEDGLLIAISRSFPGLGNTNYCAMLSVTACHYGRPAIRSPRRPAAGSMTAPIKFARVAGRKLTRSVWTHCRMRRNVFQCAEAG